MGSVVILIVIAVLISVMLSYCAAYYRECYLSRVAEESSDDDDKPDKETDSAKDTAEKIETEDVTGDPSDIYEADESEKDAISLTKKNDDASDEVSSTIASEKTIEFDTSFFKINENIPILKKYLILFFSAFSIIAAVVIAFLYDNSTAVKAIQYILYSDCLFLIATIDIKVKKIPNKLIVFLLCLRICGIICEIIFDDQIWYSILISSVIGMAVAAITLFICLVISRGGIGAGDLKMFSIIGLFFGLQGLMEIMIHSLFLASIVGIILLIAKKAKFKSSLPMAPFMFIGSMLHIIML